MWPFVARIFGFWRSFGEGACPQWPVTEPKRSENPKGPLPLLSSAEWLQYFLNRSRISPFDISAGRGIVFALVMVRSVSVEWRSDPSELGILVLMRKHAFFDNLTGCNLAERRSKALGVTRRIVTTEGGRARGPGRRTGNIRNAAGPMWKYPGTVSGTESTLFRIFPLISAYFRVTRIKKFGDFDETSAGTVESLSRAVRSCAAMGICSQKELISRRLRQK